MRSAALPLPGAGLDLGLGPGVDPGAGPAADPFGAWPAADRWRDADLVLAFLPPGVSLEARLAALAERFPHALVTGCEAVTQFLDDRLTDDGTVHVVRFETGGRVEALVVHDGSAAEAGDDGTATDPASSTPAGTDPAAIDRLASHLAGGDPVLLLADGLRCPAEGVLGRLRQALERRGGRSPSLAGDGSPAPAVAGGLGSMTEEVLTAAADGSEQHAARVFVAGRVVPAGLVALVFTGVAAEVQVMRGWHAASPVYEVTRAEGRVLWEIGGEPAAEWFGRLFSLGDPATGSRPPHKAPPLPEIAHRFPLVLSGPAKSRDGVYRSMRAFDEPPGAVTFWGEIETGDRFRLAIGNEVSLVHHTGELSPAADAPAPEAAILFSCNGRQQVLAAAAGEEVAAVHGALGGVPLSGFFSFGEIGPTPTAGPAFYNHTAILVLLAERPAEDAHAASTDREAGLAGEPSRGEAAR